MGGGIAGLAGSDLGCGWLGGIGDVSECSMPFAAAGCVEGPKIGAFEGSGDGTGAAD
jgi:hypothetical protein